MRILVLFSLILTLVSCEKDCSDGVVSAKANLETLFKNINTANPDLGDLEEALSSYLDNYEDKSCTINKASFHPHEEIKNLLAEIQTKKNKVNIKVIYGDDNRVDVADYPDVNVQELASSVAAMISTDSIDDEGNLSGETLSDYYGLCEDQRFQDELVAASCTGFLVDEDLIVTAGHCIGTSAVCTGEKWVFGYHNGKSSVSTDDVYECSEIVSLAYSSSQYLDYAVVRLDRKVEGRKPLRFNRVGVANVGDDLIIMGHPTGMSLKIADSASVRSVENEYFVANLDSFGGNSGSPVFNASSLEVEGILVRGETDYINENGCTVVNTCEDDGCDGEDSTHISLVEGLEQFKALGVSTDYSNVFSADSSYNNAYFPLSVNEKKGFDYNLSGKKFLDACISQIYEKETGVVADASEFDCDEAEFQAIYENFLDLEGLI